MTDFTGRIVLITGGAAGIGAGVAQKFLELGARVAIVDFNGEALVAKRDELSAIGEIIAIQADVSKEDDTKRYVAETIAALGPIDFFFNNAGIEGRVAPLVETTLDDFDRVIAVNLRGAFLGLKYVLPGMIERKMGSVVNTSSVGGLRASPNMSPYVASKHAVTGLTKTAALEVAAYGVRVNSVHPSPVNTRMIESLEQQRSTGDTAAVRDAFLARIPLGRYAEPSDIANLVVFLASDESSFITGVQYRVDGGMGA